MDICSSKYVIASTALLNSVIRVFEENFKTSSRWSIEEVPVNRIIPLCKHVYSQRLEYAETSIINCKKNGIPLFYPYIVHYSNGRRHLVVPPIVEERNNSFYLGDGMHRIYKLLQHKIPTVFVLMTHDCTLELPGIPQSWANVKETNIQLPGHMNFDCFSRKGLTGYSKFSNSDLFWFSSEV